MQADTLDGRLPEAAGWQRWKLATVLMVTVFIAYYDRLNISLALPLIAEQYGWGLEQKQFYGSLLMGLFFGAYGIANIFLTPWGARVGPRASLLLIICLWSLFTALGALASQWLAVFLASRVLLGLAEGIHFPMMSQLTKHWFPPHERSRANGLWIAGLFLAILSAPLLLVPLMHHLGWRAGFVLLSLAGLVISLPLVWRYVHNWPADHPRIQGAERGYIEVGLMGEASAAAQPLGSVARQPVFLLMVLVGILNNVLSLGISSWLPTYLASREGVAYQDLAYLAALPYSFSLLGLAFWSWLGDRSGRRGRNAMFGFVCAGGMIFAAFETASVYLAVGLFSLGVFFVASFNACEFAMVQRILPQPVIASGTGLYNGLTTMVGGGLGTAVMGQVMAGQPGAAELAFLLTLFLVTAVSVGVLGRLCRY